jgi:hypothetical protein
VEPPKGELCITKALRGGAVSSLAAPDVGANEKLDEELLEEELLEELVLGAGGENVRSTASAVDSIPADLPDFLPVLGLGDIVLISIAVCLL